MWDLLAGVVAALLFALVLFVPIPPAVSRLLSSYSLPSFAFVLLLYYLAFRLPEQYRWMAPVCLTMLLLSLSLSFLWRSGYSDDKIIGGLLPFRDGFDYYNGANWILDGQAIRIINEGASWRPLYPGFLAALLWFTGRNLQAALAIQVGIAGLCLALSARYVCGLLGAAAAALYVTLLYFYIQPLIGTAYTETLGLTLGCLGLVLLLDAASTQLTVRLVIGLAALMLAVSARAGTFFIFPALVVWAGWAFRGKRRYSLGYAGIALGTCAVVYLLANTLFDRLIVEPGGSPFGNFAFTLYGQVVGGAGYHKAFEDLGARDPAVILRAAERFFLAHPLSLGIGAAKAYRDFFSPASGAFSLGVNWQALVVGIVGTALLLLGVYRSVMPSANSALSLLLAGFIGILVSIPFLPPIDGGLRIYASTMPFVFALAAVPLALLFEESRAAAQAGIAASAGAGTLILTVVMIAAPVAIRYSTSPIVAAYPSCPAAQMPFETVVTRGSFIDLVVDQAGACGNLPRVCSSAFKTLSGGNDPTDVTVFDHLAAAAADRSAIRVFAGNDFLGGKPHLFEADPQQLAPADYAIVAGCATETLIKGRPSIYAIESIDPARLP